MTQSSPIRVCFTRWVWMTAPSCTDVRAPTMIGPLSARITAPGQTLEPGPMRTSPISTASGWI